MRTAMVNIGSHVGGTTLITAELARLVPQYIPGRPCLPCPPNPCPRAYFYQTDSDVTTQVHPYLLHPPQQGSLDPATSAPLHSRSSVQGHVILFSPPKPSSSVVFVSFLPSSPSTHAFRLLRCNARHAPLTPAACPSAPHLCRRFVGRGAVTGISRRAKPVPGT